jgi:hypothetical protein
MLRSAFLVGSILVAISLAATNAASAQTSTIASASSVGGGTHTVTTADFAWLAGSWEGKLANIPDAVAEITFQSPRGGTLTGVMRLVQGDKLLVIELISLVDTPRGPEMRFRHFTGALDAFETTFKQTMRLKSHDAEKDVFENTVEYDKALMSTQPRISSWSHRGVDELVAHSDIIGDDGKPGVVDVRYRRRPNP